LPLHHRVLLCRGSHGLRLQVNLGRLRGLRLERLRSCFRRSIVLQRLLRRFLRILLITAEQAHFSLLQLPFLAKRSPTTTPPPCPGAVQLRHRLLSAENACPLPSTLFRHDATVRRVARARRVSRILLRSARSGRGAAIERGFRDCASAAFPRPP